VRKVKDGGILCGHDCEGYYSQYPNQARKKIDHIDISGKSYHPGVIKALHEYFKDTHSIVPDSLVWYYIKNDNN